ncbi:MAG: hypothetical protein M1305_01090 [Candidatus Marsarchaeota archaeon]|nr:hypothetical protein [Candidatus Marsarchaeota archaeon]
MAQTNYQVTLSTGGRVAVTVTSDDQKALREAFAWARETYTKLTAKTNGKEENQGKDEDVPTCAVHNVPMVKRSGKYGEFWSCQKRNPNGSYCSYRPNGR